MQNLAFNYSPFIQYNGHDASLNNVEFNIYGDLTTTGINMLFVIGKNWDPTDTTTRIFSFTNVGITLPSTIVSLPQEYSSALFIG